MVAYRKAGVQLASKHRPANVMGFTQKAKLQSIIEAQFVGIEAERTDTE